jgi:hypothetical protein
MKYKIIILLILIIIIYWYFNNVKIIYHNNDEYIEYNDKLNDFTLKLRNWYPLNNDHFTIDFGKNYFDFFKTIGTDGFHCAHSDGDKIIGSLCCRYTRNSWYICDLKVLPEYRGKQITYKLFLKNFIPSYLKSNRAYAISMYPNVAVNKLNKNFAFLHFENLSFIHIYLVDLITIKKIYNILKIKYNYIGFIDTNNSKRLILQSNNKVLKTLHLYNSNTYKNIIPIEDVSNDYQYFFCLLEKDLYLIKDLQIKEFGKATLYAYNMKIDDFYDLSTAEI